MATRPTRSAPYAPRDRDKVMPLVLEGLRKGLTHKDAAEGAGVGLTTVKDWRREDAEFNTACELAYDEGTDVLEREAQRRAVEGVDEPVFQGGVQVGSVRKYSDTLMNIMLQGRRPAKYRQKQAVELSGPDGGPINAKLQVEFIDSTGKKP